MKDGRITVGKNMGTWGHDAFSNDDALDWLIELETTRGTKILSRPISRAVFLSRIHRALPFMKRTKFFRVLSYSLEQGPIAFAAAETVAALGRRRSREFPVTTLPWVDANLAYFNKRLAKRAYIAVLFIRDHSELRFLHDEADSSSVWLVEVDDLLARLQKLKNA